MAEVVSYRFRLRRALAATFSAINDILFDGEIGRARDTGEMKVGNGDDGWNDLQHIERGMRLDRLGDVNTSGRANGHVVSWDGTAQEHIYVAPSGGGAGGNGYRTCEDFGRGVATSTASGTAFVTGEYRAVAYTNGTGATASLDAPGVLMKTGSAVNGLVNLFTTQGLRCKLGREVQRYGCRVELPVLSDGTHSFAFNFGLRSVITGTENERLVAEYTHSANSGKWTLKATAGGTTTVANASVGPAAGTELELEIEVNAAINEANLYVDGALAATVTTNISTTAFGVACLLYKTLGATERTARIVRMWRR